MFQVSKRCYCAFCRSERVVYSKKHVSLLDVTLALIASALLSLILWQDFDPRAVVFFAIGLALAEMFILFRWRLSISCPKCGFDPVLYKKNSQLAAERVKAHMDRRRTDPIHYFSESPKLPVRVQKKESSSVSPKASTSTQSEL